MDDLSEDNELSKLDFYETVGLIESRPRKDFGRERGRNPIPSESQVKSIEKLANKLVLRSHDSRIDEETENFDLLAKTRVILFEGRVSKRSMHSLVQHSSKRHLFLLNDVFIITSHQGSNGIFSSEKLLLHKVLNLEDLSFADLSVINADENSCAFEIRSKERAYHFVTDSESDKRIWMEELESAIFCLKMTSGVPLPPGWRHEIVRGTIHSAAYYGDMDLLRSCVTRLNGETVDIVDESGICPLHLACLEGHLAVVEYLIEHHASVDVLNNGLNTPLMLAAAQGHDAIVFYLLEMGADYNMRNLKDRDALFMAVLYGHDKRGLYHIIQVLTTRGVNLNQVDASGATPLHECAARNLSRPVQLLVDAGADVNTRHGRNGLTPLQIACSVEKPDVETIRSFLDKGAHPNWKDAARRSAFDMVLRAHAVGFVIFLTIFCL